MTKKLIYPIVAVVFAAACGSDGERSGKGAGRNYEMVQEGSASGVTSTIAGPGETLPPITGTNADTTSAFTIDPNVAPGSVTQQPTAMGATLPPIHVGSPSSGGVSPGYNPSSSPAPRSASTAPAPTPAPQRPTYIPAPMTSSTRAPQQSQQQPQPEPVQREAPQEPADTDTANGPSGGTETAPVPPPTQTAPPPAQQQEEAPAEESEEPAAEEPAPPPPAR